MLRALENVYRYRSLLGKCCGGAGLSLDEIEEFEGLAANLRPFAAAALEYPQVVYRPEDLPEGAVMVKGVLRDQAQRHGVLILGIGARGVVCGRGPYLETAAGIEISIEDRGKGRSYRFKTRLLWALPGDLPVTYTLGLEFTGSPLLLRYRPDADVHDREQAAA